MPSTTNALCRLCSLRFAFHLITLVSFIAASVSSDAALPCDSTSDALDQFDVVVTTREPLGLRLSERLEILEFVVNAEGRARAVEASGLAEVGDRLLFINGKCAASIKGGLHAVVEVLQRAERPMTLRFQSRDGRRLISGDGGDASGNSASTAASGSENEAPTASVTSDDAKKAFDYVLLSDGERGADTRLFAALSGDGKPPSCGFRRLTISRPFDACEPLVNAVDVADTYVLIPDVGGCPAHQKALLAQEAGARGVILVARDNKPRQVRLPPANELPKPLRLPIAMVSRNSGERALRRLVRTPPSHELHLGFVFTAECADDKYGYLAPIGEDGEDKFEDDGSRDPRRRPVVAGFLSVSIAASASSVLSSATYEFLRPTFHSRHQQEHKLRFKVGGRRLPIGKRDLFLADDALMFQPCQADNSTMSPLLRVMLNQREFRGKVALAPLLRPPSPGTNASDARQCSLRRQLAYYSTLEFESVILWDADFPAAAHSSCAATAATDRTQALLAFAFISRDAYQTIRQTLSETAPASTRATAKGNSNSHHVQVDFTSENALHHQWQELAHLAVPSNWPSSAAVRDRLLHRMFKDHDAVADQRAQLALAVNERRDALIVSLEAAHQYYREQHEERQRRLQEAISTATTSVSAVTVSTSDSEGSTITMFYHDGDHDSTARYLDPAH